MNDLEGGHSADEPTTRSSVLFPYTSLEEVTAFIGKIAVFVGQKFVTREQMAATANMADNSTFASRLGSARLFGVIEQTEGRYRITHLGMISICDNKRDAEMARTNAFFNVGLYSEIYHRVAQLKPLPNKAFLENLIVSLGVSEKQKDKARVAFEKSAAFINIKVSESGPATAHAQRSPLKQAEELSVPQRTIQFQVERSSPSDHRLIRGMLDLMPHLGSKWEMKDRAKWIRALITNLAMVYEDDGGEITIGFALPAVSSAPTWSPPKVPPPPAPPQGGGWELPIGDDDLDDDDPL